MIRTIAALCVASALAAPAAAQNNPQAFDFAGDVYRLGGDVVFAGPDGRDAFLAGERVDLAGPIAGSAHLAGRRVSTSGAVGGDLYAAGADVRIAGPVTGAASVAGYDLTVEASIGGNLRAAGYRIDLRGPVAGGALLTGDQVEISSVIAGDAAITADELIFGEGARVDGRLTLFEEEGRTLAVPASVAPPERIDRRVMADGRMTDVIGRGWAAVIAGTIVGALVLALIVTLAGAIFPRKMARLGGILSGWPLRSLGAGFLAQSALVGGAIMLALTVIGLVLAPFALVASVLLAFCGYVSIVYLIGVWIVTRTGALEPDTFPEHAIAGLCGAVAATLLALIPFIGWLVLLALSFAGAGAIAIATFRPAHLPLR